MASAAPIARERELEQLLEAAAAAKAGQGSIVFLSGETGSGKSVLLKALLRELEANEDRLESVYVLCYETGAGNPLAPFVEVLRALASEARRGAKAKRIIELVGQVAPALVALIPGFGTLAAVGVKAAADVGVYALGGSHEEQQLQLASEAAAALARVAEEEPLLVVVDEAHWIDGASTEVIARLAGDADARPLLLVVAYDDELVEDRQPLARMRARLGGSPAVRELRLRELGRDEVETLLRHRYGEPPARLADWLHDRTDGNLLFLDRYLTALEQEGLLHRDDGGWTLDGAIEGKPGQWRLTGALADAHTPGTLIELLRPRVADLEGDERQLLETGAVQGRRFLSTVLVRLLEREEDEILDRLAELAERRRLITAESAEDWWSDRSAMYSFDPGVLQELLYGRYERSPYERKRRHAAVARALDQMIAGDRPPARHALLEIARHYEEAGEPVPAATRLVDVAESTFAEGADAETAAHAERAVALLRAEPLDRLESDARTDAQRLLARAIVLLLLGGEPSWRPEAASGGERLLSLAAEAERAAEAVGDPKLRANTRFATARVATAYRGLDETIAAYREALELAREGGDRLAELAILVNLGHQLDSVDLDEGWKVLQEAHALLTSGALDELLDESLRRVETAQLETRLGVAAFDLGRYGEALDPLVRGAQTLREAGRLEDAGWTLSFVAQLYNAIGLFEAAEATLNEAIALFKSPEPLGVRGYLRALLGHAYLESTPPRVDDARAALEPARDETRASGFRSVIPLVEAYWAELQLANGSPPALRAGDEALEAAESFGWARAEIICGSLRARIALREGRVGDAVALSTAAVAELERRGGRVPAVRSEEILFAHSQVLAAAGSSEAERYATEAARVVREKAASLSDPEHRASYETRVRLSREILAQAS
jgi:hypothetical protein